VTPRDYSYAGHFCRAHVWWYGTGAVITGRLAGEFVAKVFDETASEQLVDEWARALAHEGRWPREQNAQTGRTWLDLPAIREVV
jgi:hypothetical protein